ncbi:hypothetical protein Tco_0677413 [Tanacetum coccineum]|uniref:MAK10-like protein n=1 Tax=Tanacetum coccineum TaxID=301880 RepID=A0ABQ4XCA8_9ASTR
MDSFQGLTLKVHHHGIDLWLQVQIFYDHVNPDTRRAIDQSAGGKLRDKNAKRSWALIEDLVLYDNESWNDPRDFAKLVNAISLPRDVLNTSNRRLIELENQVQRLMKAHLAPKPSIQKIVSDKLDDAPTRDIAKTSMVHANVVSHNHQENGALWNKGIIKSPSKLLSPKYQAQSSLGEEGRNSSSPKCFHFVNTITIIRKEDEPKKTKPLELNAINSKDHDLDEDDGKMMENESKASKIIVDEGEESDQRINAKTSDFDDKSEEGKKGEWMEYEEPLD